MIKTKHHPWLRYALVCAIGLVWLAMAAAGPVGAQSSAQAISVAEFWQQVDASLAWLDGAPAADSLEWQAQAGRWQAIRAVTLPGGQTVTVDTSRIVALLEADPPDAPALRAYLASLKETRALTTAPGGEREAQLLRDILARREFQQNAGELNIFQKIYEWLLEQFWRLINLLFGNLQGSVAIPSQVTIAISVVLILAILFFVFRDTLRNLFAEVELAEESAGEGENLSARVASQRAQALSGSGDYRHALRYLYLSALLLLDERGLLRYNRAQTNREYLRQVRGRPELAGHLKEVVETFDRVWYGFQPIDEASYARYAGHVSALEETKE